VPTVLDAPPALVLGELAALRGGLDAQVPAKRVGRNLLIGTWNIRVFGGLTESFNAGPDDTPKRDLRALRYLAEIVSRFDIVAVQEVRSDLKALRHLLKLLGDDWAFLLTDVTRGQAGNNERLAFLFDTRRVRPSGLAAEIVLPPEWEGRPLPSGAGTIAQFARTPYAVSFLAPGRARRHTFVLTTVHVRYGSTALERLPELAAFADWMAQEAASMNRYHHDLIVLGDFNIDRAGDPAYQAFAATGLTVPAALIDAPRTVFSDPRTPHFYDQIAWFESGRAALQMPATGAGGAFDFQPFVYGDFDRTDMSWRMSDHLPLWLEFDLSGEEVR
jgi:endonuclease/exonuclease/phosphatase family metal-dependent hydrolase